MDTEQKQAVAYRATNITSTSDELQDKVFDLIEESLGIMNACVNALNTQIDSNVRDMYITQFKTLSRVLLGLGVEQESIDILIEQLKTRKTTKNDLRINL